MGEKVRMKRERDNGKNEIIVIYRIVLDSFPRILKVKLKKSYTVLLTLRGRSRGLTKMVLIILSLFYFRGNLSVKLNKFERMLIGMLRTLQKEICIAY